ncbi:MAG TPA: alpha/beta hydrolase [Gaiellaceae bacterium]
MRILKWLAGLLAVVVLASVAFNLVTSDPNIPVRELWHGKFVDGTAYRTWGTRGAPVVLLGGFLEPSFVWTGVAPLVARSHRVYALDLDGFGYSERRGPWTLGHWADQVQAFCARLGIRRPVVVGHSLGAAVAVELARRGVAARVVLLDGDALRSGGPPRALRWALAHSPFFTTGYRLVLRWPWLIRRILKNAYGPHHGSLATRPWTDPFRAAGARRAAQGILVNGIAGFTAAQLRALRIRARVVWGSRDSVDSVPSGRGAARDLHAPFMLVPGAGHLSMIVAPRAVARAIG